MSSAQNLIYVYGIDNMNDPKIQLLEYIVQNGYKVVIENGRKINYKLNANEALQLSGMRETNIKYLSSNYYLLNGKINFQEGDWYISDISIELREEEKYKFDVKTVNVNLNKVLLYCPKHMDIIKYLVETESLVWKVRKIDFHKDSDLYLKMADFIQNIIYNILYPNDNFNILGNDFAFKYNLHCQFGEKKMYLQITKSIGLTPFVITGFEL